MRARRLARPSRGLSGAAPARASGSAARHHETDEIVAEGDARRCRPTRSGINFAPAHPVHCLASPWRPPPAAHRMSWLSRLLGGKSDGSMKPQRLDYLNEALALERQGDFDAALTSYRLA